MNVFKDSGHLLGFEALGKTKHSLKLIFEMVSEIRAKLGLRGDLLDNYLFFIFEAANTTMVYESTFDGFESALLLRKLCYDVLEGKGEYKDHLFYDVVVKEFEKHTYLYDDFYTIAGLHYVSLAESYLNQSVLDYWNQQEQNLAKTGILQKLNEHYDKIVHLIGEGPIEELNQAIIERFFLVPAISGYIQGFMNDLLLDLNYRDCQTNKRVFQLWLAHFLKAQV